MRKTLRKLSHVVGSQRKLPLNGHTKIKKIYATTVRKMKRRPLISLGSAALAIGALSGVVAWMRLRK